MAEDIGEEIIFKLKELIAILEKKFKHEKKFTAPHCN